MQVHTPGRGRPFAIAFEVSGGSGASSSPRSQRAAFAPAVRPWTVTKSARSITRRQFPQAKTPGRVVWSRSSVSSPFAAVTAAPARALTSFSGISPTDSRRVSHGTVRAVSGRGRPSGPTWARTTPSTRPRPKISVTVMPSHSGMPKSYRHCCTFRSSAPGAWRSSATPRTCAPSSVSRRAMISPMSPDPSTTTRRPIIRSRTLMRSCAAPAV